MSGNPLTIGLDVARGIAKANREQEIREQVEKSQGLTGFEVFGQDYKQEQAGNMSTEQGFFSNLASGFTSTLGDVARTLSGIAGPANTIAGFFGGDTPQISYGLQ